MCKQVAFVIGVQMLLFDGELTQKLHLAAPNPTQPTRALPVTLSGREKR
jgi:hypothetical protein